MVATTENGMSFLLAGGVLFVVAGIAMLLRDTRDLPTGTRCIRMATKTWGGFLSILPSWKWVRVSYAFAIGYVGGVFVSGVVWFGLLYWYACTLPERAGDFGGFGDAMLLNCFAAIGVVVSQGVGICTALILASLTFESLSPPAPKTDS